MWENVPKQMYRERARNKVIIHSTLNTTLASLQALTLVAMVWLGAANIAAWDAGRHDFASTAGPYEQLTNARTQAQEMRTAETITLLTRNTQRTTMSMNDTSAEVANALDAVSAVTNADEIITARNALADWRLTHTSMMNALNSGDYDRAVELSADSGESTTATAFSLLDDSLGELIATARYAQRANINDALGTTGGMSTGIMVLMLAAIACTFIGARPRIQEYV